MIRKILLIAAILSLAGCGEINRSLAQFGGYSTVCVEGVEYIQFASGASVAYGADGKVKTCRW